MTKLKLFISYAHEDKAIKDDLDKFLITLKRSDKIDVWQDREINPGDEWDQIIKDELTTADIILLLISVDFIASEYIWKNELAVAMERHDKKEVRVIPIIARACDWSGLSFGKLQALPTGAIPITSATNRDEILTEVAKRIREVVEFMSRS